MYHIKILLHNHMLQILNLMNKIKKNRIKIKNKSLKENYIKKHFLNHKILDKLKILLINILENNFLN